MMTTQEIASRLVSLCRTGQFVQAEEELYGPEIVHIEVDEIEFKGFQNVLTKEKQFLEKLESKPLIRVSEPIVAGDFFSISMYMEINHKELGRKKLDEIIIYKVNKDRKSTRLNSSH
jgi:hypothetical protein